MPYFLVLAQGCNISIFFQLSEDLSQYFPFVFSFLTKYDPFHLANIQKRSLLNINKSTYNFNKNGDNLFFNIFWTNVTITDSKHSCTGKINRIDVFCKNWLVFSSNTLDPIILRIYFRCTKKQNSLIYQIFTKICAWMKTLKRRSKILT